MRPVRIRVVKRFPHPPDRAYAWLTDFDDADAQRTGAVVVARRVVERAPGRVVYEGETEVLGRRSWARTEVLLSPPDRWTARVVAGPREGSVTSYRLRPVEGGCEIEVAYDFVLKGKTWLLRLAKPFVARDLRRMWDGYAASMDAELRQA